MELFSVEDRHIAITGASSGFGHHFAGVLAARGAKVSLGARREEKLRARVDEIEAAGGRAMASPLDVCSAPSIDAFFDAAESALGPIDVLINNAGLARGTEKIAEGTGEAWREMIETNVLGLLEVTRRVLPHMVDNGGGHVVVIGSIAGHKAYVGGGVRAGHGE